MSMDTQGTVFIIAIGLMVSYNILWAWYDWSRIKNYIDRTIEDAIANMEITVYSNEEDSQQEEPEMEEEEENVI